MKQKNSNNKLSGSEGFNEYYRSQFGERWEGLKDCLLKDNIYYELDFGMENKYYLDPGSVCAALCLDLRNADRVLDLCAAPGGKTLVLSGNLAENAELLSNERSPERKGRLVKVINDTLPLSLSKKIIPSCSDGATWCRRESESFDSILLDAPCSSERHVLLDPKYLNVWTPSRIKTLSIEQWALLSSAWRMLKKGGNLIYATCALAAAENDEIIDRLIKKFDDVVIVEQSKVKDIFNYNLEHFSGKINIQSSPSIKEIFEKIETVRNGYHVLPDIAMGSGPLYFCVLQKKN